MQQNFRSSRGFPLPFGPSQHPNGFNFSLFSKHATEVRICLYPPENSENGVELILDPKINRTGNVWHIFVYDLPENTHYGYRLDGPYDPLKGYFYNKRAVLLDPYAKLIASPQRWGSFQPHTTDHQIKGVVFPKIPFDWEGVEHPNIPLHELVIYEMHVRGYTKDASSNVSHRGTFLGMIEKIPHLKSLGVNAVELLPIFEFNERDNILKNPKTNEPLYQYWGYSTINFFSPMNRYASEKGHAINEFKTLVKALHANGIEVILDVVYNHTAEGNVEGPILSFKGLEASVYYLLGPNGEYYNFSGCGNTLNCNTPVVREFIRDSLRYWVTEMHVDGFRFDLASVLTRDHDGIPMERPPLIEALTLDPILANTKLIAEAWDAAGLYQVGSFPGLKKWGEWNGLYRDAIRRFLKGTDGEVGHFATRLAGSEDLYGKGGHPYLSINFVTAHDGFSLADLVAYNEKHNEENGEGNRDGNNSNDSWNCGAEGVTNDENILKLRERQMRNLHLALMVSQGVPMVLMGDEYGHTKGGNNNSWCHDSRLNWFQWDALEKNRDFFRFFSSMITFRKNHPVLRHPFFLKERDITWHGIEVGKPDWSPLCRFLAFSLPDPKNHYMLYVAFNASFGPVTFKVPPKEKNDDWKILVDTFKLPPEDFIEEERAPLLKEESYTLGPYCALLLKRVI